MALATALSLCVHGAVLLSRASAGGSTSNLTPLAPVLLTRSLLAAESIASREPVAASPSPVPAPASRESTTIDEPTQPAPQPVPADRLAAPVVAAPLPLPRPPIVPASSPLPPPPTELALAPVAAPSSPSLSYLGSGALDPPPRPVSDVDPAVPAEAGPRGGVVVLRLYINERGGVDKAEVLNSAPPGLFDASVLEAFGSAKFSPGYLAGVPVKSTVTFEVRFRGLGNGTSAEGKTY